MAASALLQASCEAEGTLLSQLERTPIPPGRYEAVRAIEETFSDLIRRLSMNWAHADEYVGEGGIETVLDTRNSDYLYLLTWAACMNPSASRNFIDRVLAGEFRDFQGSVPPGDSETLVLATVDLARFAPDFLQNEPPPKDTGLLVVRNIGRSTLADGASFSGYISRFLHRERSGRLDITSDVLLFSSGYVKREVTLETPNLAAFFDNLGGSDTDSDGDGVIDVQDTNPIQAQSPRPLQPEEKLCALSIGLKIYRDGRGNLVILESPRILGFEIPVPHDVCILNVTSKDYRALRSACNRIAWWDYELANFPEMLSRDTLFSSPASPEQAVLFNPNHESARVAVSWHVGDESWTTLFEYRKASNGWLLNEVFELDGGFFSLLSMKLPSKNLWWRGRP